MISGSIVYYPKIIQDYFFMNPTPPQKKLFEKCGNSDNFKPKPTAKDKSFFDRVREMFG